MTRPLCEVRIRRNKRCCKPGRYVLDLGMVLCPAHEANEWKLRAVGYDSRQDDLEAIARDANKIVPRGYGPTKACERPDPPLHPSSAEKSRPTAGRST